jgi:lipopolysaccharide/colanic/teichoic acid biosynthesis glycosyltransferase
MFPIFLIAIPFMWVRGRMKGLSGLFFRQERIGWRGQRFRVLKFRTMNEGTNGHPPNGVLTFARRIGVDELPQVIHLLQGRMSCVGPRPLVPGDLQDCLPEEVRLRQSVLPGMAGLSQIAGAFRSRRGRLSRDLMDRDLWYVRNRSLGLDLRILGSTFVYVITFGRSRVAWLPQPPRRERDPVVSTGADAGTG